MNRTLRRGVDSEMEFSGQRDLRRALGWIEKKVGNLEQKNKTTSNAGSEIDATEKPQNVRLCVKKEQ